MPSRYCAAHIQVKIHAMAKLLSKERNVACATKTDFLGIAFATKQKHPTRDALAIPDIKTAVADRKSVV